MNKKVIIGIIAILVILAISIGLFVMVYKDDTDVNVNEK